LPDIQQLYNLPDISFVDTDVNTLLLSMITDYQAAYQQQTGQIKILAAGDPIRIWIYAQALRIYTLYQLLDYTGKQNLLKYAQGGFLDNIGARIGDIRSQAVAAVATVTFTLSAVQPSVTPIPAGTRVTAGDDVFFATTVYAEIPAWQQSLSLTVQCMDVGAAGNGYQPGELKILVDPIAYVASVSNAEVSQGGVDEQTDDQFRADIFLKPESFSVAGPAGAYEYWAKKYDASIIDVAVTSPSACTVDVRFLLQNGQIPQTAMISGLTTYLSADNIRPLTDNVTVGAPTPITYNLTLTYYIDPANAANAVSIQTAVNAAIVAYNTWQQGAMGRDINPDYLTFLLQQAGVKRAVITSPTFTQIWRGQIVSGTAKPVQVAQLGTKSVVYGGLDNA
jgi:phage-related baseplate assembly protein